MFRFLIFFLFFSKIIAAQPGKKEKLINAKIHHNAFSIDTFFARPDISNIINSYTPVLFLNSCDNKIDVEDATAFNIGDTVLIIQMKGAVIDSTNSAAFGTITDYRNAGNYEFNYVKNKSGNILELKNKLTRQYNIPIGKVQLVRVPYYQNVNVTGVLTCLPWDGTKGGILAFNVQDTLTLTGTIDVTGKGFRGGVPLNNSIITCDIQTYYNTPSLNNGGQKGESIHAISISRNYGRGSPASGGGGGNAHNSGGGGGGNAGSGGNGGDQWEGCKTNPQTVGGLGGKSLQNSAILNKIYLGGGGGMGHGNDQNEYSAGNGGGIVIIKATVLNGNNNSIKANGIDGITCGSTGVCNDGMSGGGAGGSILLDINFVNANTVVEAVGGNGANSLYIHPINPNYRVGPGGGGGGGFVGISQSVISPLFTLNMAGGMNGVLLTHNNDPYLATPGASGMAINSFPIVTDLVPFKPNIDSVRIKDTLIGCATFDFLGFGYTNSNPISSWQWYFGDGGVANTQNTSHIYISNGTFLVKLVVTDINGCKDSISKNITVSIDAPLIQTIADSTICEGNSIQLSATGGVTYLWTPATGLSNPNINNPTASPVTTTEYIVTGTNIYGCSAKDTVLISVNPKPIVTITSDTTICKNTSVQLLAGGGISYIWFPSSTLNNPSIPNPIASPLNTTTYRVTVTDAQNCSNQDSVTINIVSPAQFSINSDKQACLNTSVQLQATGGDIYLWQPSSTLNDTTIANPLANPTSTTIYSVTIKETKCNESATLTTKVTVLPLPDVRVTKSNDVDCSQNQSQLIVTGAITYLWSPEASLNNPTIANPIATPVVTTVYTVLGTDTSGCMNTDTITVKVTGNNISGYLMATAFTPNGDGLNDCYGIKYWGVIEALEFRIYNRWGEMVFYTNNPSNCWDGSYKGVIQNSGVFVYMIKAKTGCNPEVFKKGTFVLIK